MNRNSNFYASLGVPKDATQAEIQRAYHQAARRLHPDVNNDPGATELFIEIQEAYDVLSNPSKRKNYDKKLKIIQEDRPPIKLDKIYSQVSIMRLSEPQLFYSLLDIEIQQDKTITAQTRAPLNIALVLDKSTSMKGMRINILKSTAIELLRLLDQIDIVSIIAFNDWSEVILPAGPRTNLAKVESKIHAILADGGTEILKGLKSGLVELRRFLSTRYINHIILITDGRSYGDEEKCLELADQAQALGISISTLGIGSDYNDEFLDELAMRTGGSSKFVSSPQDIRFWLKEKFTRFGQAYVERAKLNYIDIPGVKLRYVISIGSEVSILSPNSPIQLGSFLIDSQHRILLEFLLEPINNSSDYLQLMDGDISFDIPTRQIPTYRIPLSLTCPVSDSSKSDVIPIEIINAVSRLTFYRMQEEARKNIRDGELEAGRNVLRYLATQLIQDGNHQLAKVVNSELESIHQQGSFSKQGDKIIKYGTRALLLP
ncbi:MAG: DnaJ domain-containing protein, partial [Anaerolineales bacterium]